MRVTPVVIIAILITLSLTGCASQSTACIERSDFCTQEYDPVTGSDGVEYSNACMACSNPGVQSWQ